MDIEKKLQETITYHNAINQQIIEVEQRLDELKDLRQQCIGRIQTYRELQLEEPVANKSESESN